MRRKFKTEEDFTKAAERRRFTIERSKDKEESPPAPAPTAVSASVPEPPPPPSPPPDLTPIAQEVRGGIEKLDRRLMRQVEERAQADRLFAKTLEALLERASEANHRPMRWKITVAARDYEGRISSLDVEANDTLNS